MKLKDIPFELIDWTNIEAKEVNGITEKAYWRTKNFNDVRIRIIEKLPGYRADHYCRKGHIIHIISGSMEVYFENGDKFNIKEGESLFLSDVEENGHSTYTEKGVKYFIID